MTEWNCKSKYNSFNSYKGLTYYEHYKKIVAWLDGKGQLPAPIEASLDPISHCNQKCYYCNSQRYLRKNNIGIQSWDKDFIGDTLSNLAEMGCKAFCWGGGGEALLNNNVLGMTEYGVGLGMECSIITNGVYLHKFDDIGLCRWIGISLDSAVPEVYEKIRGTNDCLNVLYNIENLVKSGSKADICVKVLILPENIDTIVYTCRVARDIGVTDFHLRPVDLCRKDYKGCRKIKLDRKKIEEIFTDCHKMETNDFHVYTVTHKYNEDFSTKQDFDKCLASPLVTQICTDKKIYACVDHRLEQRFEVHNWGSEKHRQMIKSILPIRECSKCTWCEYNKQVEDVVIKDRMCVNFP